MCISNARLASSVKSFLFWELFSTWTRCFIGPLRRFAVISAYLGSRASLSEPLISHISSICAFPVYVLIICISPMDPAVAEASWGCGMVVPVEFIMSLTVMSFRFCS